MKSKSRFEWLIKQKNSIVINDVDNQLNNHLKYYLSKINEEISKIKQK